MDLTLNFDDKRQRLTQHGANYAFITRMSELTTERKIRHTTVNIQRRESAAWHHI